MAKDHFLNAVSVPRLNAQISETIDKIVQGGPDQVGADKLFGKLNALSNLRLQATAFDAEEVLAAKFR